ncbi:MAG TPA: sulfur oxidation c-type cytochrome SoxA [Burkholderiales bacterium]|nr:sulfur oxidation c-type cytochrome SoxA [Burkholderiales bacterium]
MAALALPAHAADAERAIPPEALRSGVSFAGTDVQAMQADDFANPGMLWVERGAKLWSASSGAGKSCSACHGDAAVSMKGVAARYPAWDDPSQQVLTLDARINRCRTRLQHVPALPQESEDLLALSTYVATQSRGIPVKVRVDGGAAPAFERARALYYRRIGQFNLSCAQCHEQSWGKRIYRETVSQGHGTAYPGYRLDWQALGSLERRLRACYSGIRAEMPDYGSAELAELQLYLAWRAEGLPVEAPGVRR